jgi:hypothetical protein
VAYVFRSACWSRFLSLVRLRLLESHVLSGANIDIWIRIEIDNSNNSWIILPKLFTCVRRNVSVFWNVFKAPMLKFVDWPSVVCIRNVILTQYIIGCMLAWPFETDLYWGFYRVSHIRCSTAPHERGCAACPRREQDKTTLRRLAAVKTR